MYTYIYIYIFVNYNNVALFVALVLTQHCLGQLHLLVDLQNFRGIFRILAAGLLRFRDLLLVPVLILVQAVDSGAALAPLGVQIDNL